MSALDSGTEEKLRKTAQSVSCTSEESLAGALTQERASEEPLAIYVSKATTHKPWEAWYSEEGHKTRHVWAYEDFRAVGRDQ